MALLGLLHDTCTIIPRLGILPKVPWIVISTDIEELKTEHGISDIKADFIPRTLATYYVDS